MGTQDSGRRRMPNREDDALNLIAREAEARLAAKRAARAEAREIRMKELERQQNEISDDEERMSVGSRGSLRVEDRDRDLLEKGSRPSSTLASLSRASSRRGSGDATPWADPETSLREMKDSLLEVEEKYRKAMVFNAQLDNEKTKLMYQVDMLKDSLTELEEQLSESRRQYEEKSKEFERERHTHTVLQFQFSEMKEMLKQSEGLLTKHGIVLGPDLNANGDTGAVIDRLTNAESAPRMALDSHTGQTGGDSILGKVTEGQMEGKELQEGGSRELVANAGSRIDEPQKQQEVVESQEGGAAEGANELASPASCDQAGAVLRENPDSAQYDFLIGPGDDMQNSEAASLLQDPEELKELNGTEEGLAREGETCTGSTDKVVEQGIPVTEGQTASQECGTEVENTQDVKLDSVADTICPETVTMVNPGERGSSYNTGDTKADDDRVRNDLQGNESEQTGDTARDTDEEAGGTASVCVKVQALAAEITVKDRKEEGPTSIEGDDERTESTSINQEVENVSVASEAKEKEIQDIDVKTGQPKKKKKKKGKMGKSSAQSVTPTSQPGNSSTSGKKKKKRKGKQKLKANENPQEAKQEDEAQERRTEDSEETDVVTEMEPDHLRGSPGAEEPLPETAEETEVQMLKQALWDDKEDAAKHDGGNQSELSEFRNVEDCHVSSDNTASGNGIEQEVCMLSECSSVLVDETDETLSHGTKQADVEDTSDHETFSEESITSEFQREAHVLQEVRNESDYQLEKGEGNIQGCHGAQEDLSTKCLTESEGALLEAAEIEQMDSCEEAEVLVEEPLSEYHKKDQACTEDIELQERVVAQTNVTLNTEFAADLLLKDSEIERDVAGQSQTLPEERNISSEEPLECIIEESVEEIDSQNIESKIGELTVPELVKIVAPNIPEEMEEGGSKLEEMDSQPIEQVEEEADDGESFQYDDDDDDSGLDLEESKNTSRCHEDSGMEEASTHEGQGEENKESTPGQYPESSPEQQSGSSVSQDPSIRECSDVPQEGGTAGDLLGTVGVEQVCDGSHSVLASIEEGEEAIAFVTGSESAAKLESQPAEEPPEGSEEQVNGSSAKGSKKGKGKEECRMA